MKEFFHFGLAHELADSLGETIKRLITHWSCSYAEQPSFYLIVYAFIMNSSQLILHFKKQLKRRIMLLKLPCAITLKGNYSFWETTSRNIGKKLKIKEKTVIYKGFRNKFKYNLEMASFT